MKHVKILGEETITKEELPKWIYKHLKPGLKMNRSINEKTIEQGMVETRKVYHPMWVVKILVIAERKPFSPKITPNMIFVDGTSGYRGLFTTVPPTDEKEVTESAILPPVILKQELKEKYVKDVQDKQISRKYVLKKPKYQTEDIELIYLPVWEVKVETDFFSDTYYVNGNTGESEELLRKLGKTEEWML